ncbi:MAG: DUF2220 family protein [Pirellulaceae bacterium]|nr:DUF2220 family protein [Pirellulaceae bacterium]
MITPDELFDKALRLYPNAIEAWLANDEKFFPYIVRANTTIPHCYDEAKEQFQLLRAGSKQATGSGYSIHWETRKLRKHGEQACVSRITIDSLDDLLTWIGKQSEFKRLDRCFRKLREQCPHLIEWTTRNWRHILEFDAVLDDLLMVVNYLRDHPRPQCYFRELPLPVSTKLIEEHSKLLAEWLDILLPVSAIDYSYSRDQFAGRYGFRKRRDHYLMRLLDESLLGELQCPGNELSMPLETLASLPIRDTRILIVENKTNLLTLPPRSRTVALGGLGNSVSQLFTIPWLATNELHYWGDIDLYGFFILSLLRQRMPHTKSLMMDIGTLQQMQSLVAVVNQSLPHEPEHLLADEVEAFIQCREHHWRLEQERIPQGYVIQSILN